MTIQFTQSQKLYQEALEYLPGGVNSPVRAFNGVYGDPIFIDHADKAYLFDVDGNAYIDYVGSYGPLILGHNHPTVRDAVIKAVHQGLTFGAPTFKEIELAKIVTSLMPSIEQIRMVNSGTEATMSALRLARAYTKRDKIIKFEGCYHGHADFLLVKAGSGALTLGHPTSPGVPTDFTRNTLVCNYNDLDSVRAMFEQYPNEIAAIIVEPIAGNMNCVPATQAFLTGLKTLTEQFGALLIFDEVMTGFRVALGGAQSLYQIEPDLTCLGKIIGGGMPVGAFGGRKEIMQLLAPIGPVYQAGTLSGNPIAMSAGCAALTELNQVGIYNILNERTTQLINGLKAAAEKANIPMVFNQVGSMFGLYFTAQPEITSYQQVMNCNVERFKQFHQFMLAHGVYFAPAAFEASFLSLAHGENEIAKTIEVAQQFFNTIK